MTNVTKPDEGERAQARTAGTLGSPGRPPPPGGRRRLRAALALCLLIPAAAAVAAGAGEVPASGLPTRSALVRSAVRAADTPAEPPAPAPAPGIPPAVASVPAVPAVPAPPPSDVAVPSAPAAFTGPPAPASRPAGLDVAPTGVPGVYGVFIGVDDYPGDSADLRYAVTDAETADLAVGSFGVPASNRLVVRNGQADAATVRAAADWLVARAGPGSIAVWFFAGHVRDLGGGHQALVTAEGADLRDDELAQSLAPIRAERSWVVIAGCYGGGFDEVRAPGRIVTGAAPAGLPAYESSLIGGSYLVHHLFRRGWLDRLAGPSVQDAFAFTVAAIDRPDREPVQYDDLGTPLRLDDVATPQSGTRVGPAPPPIQVARPSKSCLLGLCG